MAEHRYHLAQLNIARMRAPLDDPLMKGFVDQLELINAIADQAPGFIWRLQGEEGNATAVRAFEDDRLIINMSVWASMSRYASMCTAAVTASRCDVGRSGSR